MMRSILFLLAVPLSSVVGQLSGVRITLSSPNEAAFRIIGVPVPSMAIDCATCARMAGADSVRPLIARGRMEFTTIQGDTGIGKFAGIEVVALDTTTAIHVEARQNGRLIASADGVYLRVLRDTIGIAIEARGSVPPASARTLRRPE